MNKIITLLMGIVIIGQSTMIYKIVNAPIKKTTVITSCKPEVIYKDRIIYKKSNDTLDQRIEQSIMTTLRMNPSAAYGRDPRIDILQNLNNYNKSKNLIPINQ